MTSWPFVTRADLDRRVDHACTLRARALASGETWVAAGGLFADALAPVVELLRRGRAAIVAPPVVGPPSGGPTAAA